MEDSGEFKYWFSEVFWPGREKVVYLIGAGLSTWIGTNGWAQLLRPATEAAPIVRGTCGTADVCGCVPISRWTVAQKYQKQPRRISRESVMCITGPILESALKITQLNSVGRVGARSLCIS